MAPLVPAAEALAFAHRLDDVVKWNAIELRVRKRIPVRLPPQTMRNK